jgi:hypothetical protein
MRFKIIFYFIFLLKAEEKTGCELNIQVIRRATIKHGIVSERTWMQKTKEYNTSKRSWRRFIQSRGKLSNFLISCILDVNKRMILWSKEELEVSNFDSKMSKEKTQRTLLWLLGSELCLASPVILAYFRKTKLCC